MIVIFDNHNLSYIFNEKLVKLFEWFCANKLSINIEKTNFIVFGNKRKTCKNKYFKIVVNGIELKNVSSTKFLRVYIHEEFNWKAQCPYC